MCVCVVGCVAVAASDGAAPRRARLRLSAVRRSAAAPLVVGRVALKINLVTTHKTGARGARADEGTKYTLIVVPRRLHFSPRRRGAQTR